jgi:hypothetical protein
MDEAPKELWADWDYEEIDGVCGVHTQRKYASHSEPEYPPIRYVRADCIEELEAELAEKPAWISLKITERNRIIDEWQSLTKSVKDTDIKATRLCKMIEAKLKELNT